MEGGISECGCGGGDERRHISDEQDLVVCAEIRQGKVSCWSGLVLGVGRGTEGGSLECVV